MRTSTIVQLLVSGAVTVSSLALPDNHDYSNDDVCHVESVIVKLTPLDQYVGRTFPLLSPQAAASALSNSETCLPTATAYNPMAAVSTPAAANGSATYTAPAAYSTYSVSGNVYTTSVAATTYYASNTYAPSTTPAAYSSTPGYSSTPAYSSGPAVYSTYVVSGNTYTTLAGETTYAASTAPVYSTYTVSGTPYTTLEAYTTYAASTTSVYSTYVASGTTYTTQISSAGYTSSPGQSTTASTTGSTTAAASTTPSTTLATSTKVTTSKTTSASPTGTQCSNPSVRVEWRNMQESDKQAYLKAELCLFKSPSKGVSGATNRHEDLQALHQQLSGSIHGVGQFLPWHRNFLHAHEVLLRTECSYNGPMPWWNEVLDAGHFESAPIFGSNYFGSCPPPQGNPAQATCITDGVFADMELNIGPGMGNSRHCLARAADEGLSSAVTQGFVNTCNSYPTYNQMQGCVFPGTHAYTHDAVGAVMSDVASSPGDPIFYLHHAFIDRNWAQWQAAGNGRTYEIQGYTTASEPAGGWVNTSLDTILDTLGVLPSVPLKNVMDTRGGYLCYTYDS